MQRHPWSGYAALSCLITVTVILVGLLVSK